MNQLLSLRLVEELVKTGVREFLLCPGARNSPLVDFLLHVPGIETLCFFEERSAAFFALGRIKAHGRPVAVVTTSGTAAGELLPATMEACYTSLPLVLVTADRPRRFRGTGAPQTAEQVGIYGVYAERCIDAAGDERFSLEDWSRKKPLHLNPCYEEPLLDKSAESELPAFRERIAKYLAAGPAVVAVDRESTIAEDIRTSEIADYLNSLRAPLVVVGSLRSDDHQPVEDFLVRLGAPVYLEAQSGLRESPRLVALRVHGSDQILARARKMDYVIDGVLRVGAVPTLRLWRDLEALEGKIPVRSVNREPYSGLSHSPILVAEPGLFLGALAPKIQPRDSSAQAFLSDDRARFERILALMEREPRSEAALFHSLSRAIPKGSSVYIGNSLPIREWDLAATFEDRHFAVSASRGLNGIDGQISTWLGMAEKSQSWGIFGDLTTLYDLPGPWALSQMDASIPLRCVVVNNGGGRIFSRIFARPEFQNEHEIEFSSWAKMWNLPYLLCQDVPQAESLPHRIVIELRPDAQATDRFWKEHDAVWKA